MFYILLVAAIVMTPFMVVSLVQHKLTWIDVAWSFAMGVCAIALAFMSDGDPLRRGIVASMVGVWASRLVWHLASHRLGKAEDGRYVELRQAVQKPDALLIPALYIAEAALVPLCLLPVAAVMQTSNPFGTIWDILGIALFLLALSGETIADAQLESFRQQPRNAGRTCRSGMWYFSRHPNYFFEWVHWWAYVAMAIGTPAFALTLTGPIVMFIFLYYITGIPHIERRSLKSRGREYLEYQQTTSVFFPWFPAKKGTTR